MVTTVADMSRYLLTGGAGFIGSHVASQLLAEGHEIVVVDNLESFYDPSIKRENIQRLLRHPGVRFFESDIRRWEEVEPLFQGDLDGVVHLAAKAGVRPSLQNPSGYVEANVAGTANVIEAARRSGVQQVVFASSSSVYGVNPQLPWSESTAPLLPISPYALTKLAGERLGAAASAAWDLEFTACRIFTVYGPRQRPDLAITKFARSILNGEAITLFGDGGSTRDYTFVGDIAQGLVASLVKREPGFRVFNLASGSPVSLRGLVETLEDVLGTRAVVEHTGEQAGDVPATWGVIDEARARLAFEPTTELRDGLEQSLDWFSRVAQQAGRRG